MIISISSVSSLHIAARRYIPTESFGPSIKEGYQPLSYTLVISTTVQIQHMVTQRPTKDCNTNAIVERLSQ